MTGLHAGLDGKKPVFSVLLAGVLWGLISVFTRQLNAGGMSPLQIASVRMAVSAVLFPLVLLIRDRNKLRIHLRDIWMFVGTGVISVSLFNVFYFYTMVHSEVSVAVVLLYTSPVFIMLLSAVIYHEKITGRGGIALLMTVTGCAFTAGITGGLSVTPLILLTGLASGLFYGLYTIFGRAALAKYDTTTVTAYTFLFAAVVCVPLGNPAAIAGMCVKDPMLILWGLGIGIFSTVLPYYFYTWGLQRMESGRAAILVTTEPLVGCVLGIAAYGESADPAKLVGIALILGSVLLLG